MYKRIKNNEFFRYCVVGGASAAIDWSLFYILAVLMNIYYEMALIASFLLSAIANYKLNKDYTFNNTSRKVASQFTSYCALVALTLIISGILLHILIHYFNHHDMYARIITSMILGVINYALNKLIPFNQRFFN